MKVSSKQAEKLLRGDHKFSQLGFSMMITRLKGAYSENASQESLQKLTGEINTFLDKFGNIMAKDFEIIEKL